jgi:hypothetical protein
VAGRPAEHQQKLKRRHRLVRQQLQPGGFCGADHRLRIHALVRRWPRSASARIEADDAQPPERLEGSRHVPQYRDRIVHLVVHVDDQHGVDARRQPRVVRHAEYRAHVLQPFPLYAAADRLDHLRLNVFGVDQPVRSDTPREMDREPPAASAEIRDDRSFRDEQ